MKKRGLAMGLALAMLALCLGAGVAQAALPDSFTPQTLAGGLNDAMAFFARDIFPEMDAAQIAALAAGLRLEYSETDGSLAYYDNADWSLEVAAHYEGAPDISAPADAVSVTVLDSAAEGVLALVRKALCYVVADRDPAADADALEAWMAGAAETGDMFPLDTYAVMLVREQARWQYVLLPGERIGPEAGAAPRDGGDGFESLARPGDVLAEWNGFSARLLRVEPRAHSDGSVALLFYMRFINDSPRALWLQVEDAAVDGVPVRGVGETGIYRGMDSGADSGEYIFLQPADGDERAGAEAIGSAHAATMLLRLVDDETYETLYETRVTVSLREVEDFTPRPTVAPTPTPVPYRPLEILPGAFGRWERLDDDRIGVRVEVTNASRQEAVKAFEVAMYCTDVWGEPLYGEGVYYYATTVLRLAPGETGYCDRMVMPDRGRVSRVYAGIRRVVLSDDTVLDYGDVRYSYWDVTW